MFKKIEINIPFYEALTHIPQCAKFMKDIFNKKRKTLNISRYITYKDIYGGYHLKGMVLLKWAVF